MLSCRDFVPAREFVKSDVFLAPKAHKFGTFEEAIAAAGAFIKENGIRPLQIETVLLPNIWDEEGSRDTSLSAPPSAHWHQIVRVWYDDDPLPAPYR
jgi:hypothetical protein